MSRGRKAGFTLVEALVSVVILSIGIVVALGTLGAIGRAQNRALETEEMQRLALRKYDEIVALKLLPSGQTQGDFLEIHEERYVWRADRTPTGTGALDTLRVEVAPKGAGFHNSTQVQGLICRPKEKS
ncbi:type II secretion system protein [Fimbriimonas ginsengisoli]|uniref:General secretion pathway protein I n=1 Tax=Fimbriimonas ginsengisoli Gsoil 348 TaxID=661478 RepID=A0A068NWL5_FIMGI|nr:type II secretion system protein [Fimbriimonas ginsengisoli]AIE85984.1 hypothetical protein OP10G_2616 [Fimbriimonas ginsengisoli Gsoil 348]